MKTPILVAVVAALITAAALPQPASAQASPPPFYSIINVNPAGTPAALAHGVNDDYQVVGNYIAGSVARAFLWMPGVPSFPFDSSPATYAIAINDLGQIAGDGYNATDGRAANATIWSPASYLGTTYTKTVDLAGVGTDGSDFTAIDDNGDAVGFLSSSNTGGNALEWEGGSLTGPTDYFPYAMNTDLGNSAGYQAGAAWALNLDNGIAPTALPGGLFGGITYTSGSSSATGIDEADDVIGDDNNQTARTIQPFAWDGVTGKAYGPLGNLPRASYGYATAINTITGDVVGQSGYHAFLWQGDITNPSGGTMTDLNSLVESNSGWSLREATGQNDYGAIVGYGYYQQKEAAFLAIPVILSSLTTDSPTAVGGTTIAGTITLDAPAPFDMDVTVTTYSAKVNFGAGIYTTGLMIHSGDTSARFVANSSSVTVDTPVTLKATFGGWRRYAKVDLLP